MFANKKLSVCIEKKGISQKKTPSFIGKILYNFCKKNYLCSMLMNLLFYLAQYHICLGAIGKKS